MSPRQVTAQDRERGEEDSVLSLLRKIEAVADYSLENNERGTVLRQIVLRLAREAIAQIEAYSKAPGHKDWKLAISEKRRDLEQRDGPPRPMTGFLATLTAEQEERALAYRGPDTLGDPELGLNTQDWPGDPPQSDADFTRDPCTTAD